jgi:hypothetical protein
VATVVLFAAKGTLLELKPIGNGQSEYRVVKTPLNLQSYRFGSKDIGDANYVIQYDAENWAYYCPRPAEDTFAVRFVPPAKCSLVAFTWIGYNTTTGAEGQPVDVFVKMHNNAADYSTYPGNCEYDGTEPSPMKGLLWSGQTSAPGNMVWDTVNIDPPVDVMDSVFFCGYSGVNVLDTVATLCENPAYTGNPLDVHTYQFNEDGAGGAGGWFAYYYTTCGLPGTYMNAGIRAYVKAYENVPPNVVAENLPNSYDTGDRTVSIYGYDFGPDSSAVVIMELFYQVNGGGWSMVSSNTPVTGAINDGIWEIDIPGVGVGDVVEYYVVGKDWVNAVDTSGIFTYEIKAGESGDFLYVINDDDPADILPEYWLDECDVWDVGAEGNYPDASVIGFYNTVIWRDWGCLGLGPGANYGIGGYGVLHSDSTAIKDLLDAGGNFWLSDEDMGYGLGICPNYGQQGVPATSWVRGYLGIKGMFDDGPLAGGPVTVLGDPMDPVIGDMFAGIGFQAAGQVYIQPGQPWIGNFDSLDATAIPNMFATGGEVVSYRFEGGAVHSGKVFGDFYPFDYIRNPADTTQFDQTAVDSLVEDVLVWFGWSRQGISDESIQPENVVRLLPMGLVSNEALIRFSLPKKMVVSLDIYDNTGRLIDNLVSGELNGGLHTIRWAAKVANGVYFYNLKAGGSSLSDKMVVIR